MSSGKGKREKRRKKEERLYLARFHFERALADRQERNDWFLRPQTRAQYRRQFSSGVYLRTETRILLNRASFGTHDRSINCCTERAPRRRSGQADGQIRARSLALVR